MTAALRGPNPRSMASVIARISIAKLGAHCRVQPVRRSMAGGAHRPLGDRAQHSDLGAEVHHEPWNVGRATAGVGGDQCRSPGLWRIGTAPQPMASATGRNAFLAADPPDDPDDVDMTRLDGECWPALPKPLRQLA